MSDGSGSYGSGRGRLAEFGRSLTVRDRRGLGWMAVVVLALHIVGFGVLLGVVAPAHFQLGGDHPVFTAGVGVLAYTFGLRHAFDADHIAAVDNATRKLIAERASRTAASGLRSPQPLSVGFWFSLGHSTIVFALSLLLALGARSLAGQLDDGASVLHHLTGIIGPV
ncbi:MAG: HoxN/HupN/NixA family nickel/cobalt transporter, partial [Sinomonas sp.]|nr:HoxN/HupN/NixA family nickel/cobalt transporter [Sinomonas sp.]